MNKKRPDQKASEKKAVSTLRVASIVLKHLPHSVKGFDK